ncbi:hypothetical protein TWF481_000799 [Arthrobotrys musiformis]|uniref:Uncharacterized protein n=1 Tax=Arthrobotrys musiformis TaxID=47236 RepID=A0AAV9WQX6_9PEZI
MADEPTPKPQAEDDDFLKGIITSLRNPHIPTAGQNLPTQYQPRNGHEKHTYKLICLAKDLMIHDEDLDPKKKSHRRSHSLSHLNDETPPPTNGPLKDLLQKPENTPISPVSYKDFDNPTNLVNDPTATAAAEPSKPTPGPRNYRPEYRYYLTEAQDFDYETMLAIFSVCKGYGDAYILPLIDLLPDALYAIQTIKSSLNAEERKNKTNKEWELAQLFYILLEGDLCCLFLEQREASGLRGSAEVRECIQKAEEERENEAKTGTPKRSLIRRILGLPPKKPRRPLTEEEIRRTEEIIMAIRII